VAALAAGIEASDRVAPEEFPGIFNAKQGLNFGIRGTELTPTSNKLFVVMIFLVQGRTGSGDLRGRKADQDGFRIPRAFASLQVSCVLIGQMGF
jgi:hypothetical protein